MSVEYTITGGRTSDGDWVGLFQGNGKSVNSEVLTAIEPLTAHSWPGSQVPWWDTERQPEFRGECVCHFMANGMPSGSRNIRVPSKCSEYHFRYFFKDREDEAAAISNTITVTTPPGGDLKEPLPLIDDFPTSQTIHVPSCGFSMWSANVSTPGFFPEIPTDRQNQDRFFTHTSLDNNHDQHMFGVVDGHGSSQSGECWVV